MMISERHKTNNLVTIFCCWLCLLLVACPSNCLADEVFEVLPQTSQTSKTANRQDEVNVLAIVTPNATTAPRLDPNNNNEWRPLGHGDPLQKDPTYDYSPPALDRVRYWAENNGSNQEARQKLPAEVLRNKTKSEILLLGVASERGDRLRTAQVKLTSPYVQQQQQQQQAKYAAIRRSYYAPQQQQQLQQQQQQHRPHTHLMPPPMMMKGLGGHVEYRHSVMNSPSSSSYMSMNMASMGSYSPPSSSSSYSSAASSLNKPMSSTHFYSSPSTATSSWYSHSPSMSSQSGLPQRMSYGDAHHQESMQHYSFSRPNSIGSNSNNNNKLGAQRKPWLHELLQKELVKPTTTMKQRMKPTMPATKYLMGTTRPQQSFTPPTYAPLTYAPVTFVPGPPTIETPTTSTSSPPIPEIYITPTTLTPTFNAGFRPMSSTTTTTATTPPPVTMTTTTMSSSRLMIPQTSNLSRRPTVAPAPELTTDALFSHYKQPPKPLLGPMYLIIEGHSKVKTYGQNELDPHSPKIVPVISKREPVVRIADPNEKRGTVETYQVKHLHTKTMPLTTTTTTPATTTTVKPIAISSNSSSSSATTTTTTATPPPSGVQDLLSLLDNMFQDAHEIVSSSTTTTTTTESAKTILKPVTTTTTKLLPQQPEPRIASKANSIESLLEETEFQEKGKKQQEDEVKYGSEIATSTEPEQPPRATRQIFDYDQLPESRIKNEDNDNDYDDDQVELEEEDGEEEAELLDDSLADVSEDDETSDSEHNLIKRIDKFVVDVDDDGDDDLDDLIEGLSPGDDDDDDDDDHDDDQDVEKQLH